MMQTASLCSVEKARGSGQDHTAICRAALARVMFNASEDLSFLLGEEGKHGWWLIVSSG